MPRKKKVDLNKVLQIVDKPKTNTTKYIIISVLFVLLAFLLLSLLFSNKIESLINKKEYAVSSLTSSKYKVHFIDVGQGDSELIQLPDNKVVLIDTGKSSAKNNLLNYIDLLNITQIDYFIVTHPDTDHYGNVASVLEKYDVITMYLPTVYSNYEITNNLNIDKDFGEKLDTTWSKAVEAVYKEKETTLKEIRRNFVGEKIEGENYVFEFYSPLTKTREDWNAYSPIIKFDIFEDSYMFVGDADENDEEEFLLEYKEQVNSNTFDCDVLKVGHHGSKTSSTTPFLNAIKPEYSVICVGKNNTYKHPTDEALNRLKLAHSQIFRTDEMGNIIFGDDANGKLGYELGITPQKSFYLYWKNVVIGGSIVIVICIVITFSTINKEEKKTRQK